MRAVARFEDHVIDIETAMQLASPLRAHELAVDAVEFSFVKRAASHLGLRVSRDELQVGADVVRAQLGLWGADETRRWLSARGASEPDLERLAQREVLMAKVRRAITDADVDPYFDEHRSDYDRAIVCASAFESHGASAALYEAVRAGADFHALRVSAVRAEREHGRFACGRLFEGFRIEFPAAIADGIFSATTSGTTLEPVEVDGLWWTVLVEDLEAARLTPEVENHIQDLLFQEWLSEESADVRYGPSDEERQ